MSRQPRTYDEAVSAAARTLDRRDTVERDGLTFSSRSADMQVNTVTYRGYVTAFDRVGRRGEAEYRCRWRAAARSGMTAEIKNQKTRERARPRRTQAERRETTRRLILDTARKLFAKDGFQATSLDAIASNCGVTKGAFYHHFDGKEELFEAVFVEEQQRIAAELAETYEARREQDPIKASLAASQAFLEISRKPDVQRITLVDAPSVLGWERMRQIEHDYGLQMMKEGIRNAISANRSQRRDVDALAYLLFGALCEGALYMASAEDQKSAQRKVEREFKAIIEGLTGT